MTSRNQHSLKGKALKVGVSFPPALHAQADAYVNDRHGGNFSGYIQRLVAQDLGNKSQVSRYDPTIISTLAEVYAGYMAPALKAQLEGADQPLLLHQILVWLCNYLASGGQFPDFTFPPSLAQEFIDSAGKSSPLRDPSRQS